MQEGGVNHIFTPAAIITINQNRNFSIITKRAVGGDYLLRPRGRKPDIMENMNRVSIAHSPLKAFLNYIPSLQDTFPGKGTVTFFGLKNGTVGKELCFEKPVEERVIVVQQPVA